MENVQTDAVKISEHPSYYTLIAVGFLFPLIGLIIGLVFIAKSDPFDRKLGRDIITWSILWMLLGTIAWFVFYGALFSV